MLNLKYCFYKTGTIKWPGDQGYFFSVRKLILEIRYEVEATLFQPPLSTFDKKGISHGKYFKKLGRK